MKKNGRELEAAAECYFSDARRIAPSVTGTSDIPDQPIGKRISHMLQRAEEL